MRKFRELAIVLALVALVVAFYPQISQREAAQSPPVAFVATSTPAPFATSTAEPAKPARRLFPAGLKLEVVERSENLDDLVVRANVHFPNPVRLALHDGRPVSKIYLTLGNLMYDLAHTSLTDDGFPDLLPTHKFHDETLAADGFTWEIRGRDLAHPQRKSIEGSLAQPFRLHTSVPYENEAYRPGRPLNEKYLVITGLIKVPELKL